MSHAIYQSWSVLQHSLVRRFDFVHNWRAVTVRHGIQQTPSVTKVSLRCFTLEATLNPFATPLNVTWGSLSQAPDPVSVLTSASVRRLSLSKPNLP
eukprot:7272368-Pyramimonas_sp.AAC.2